MHYSAKVLAFWWYRFAFFFSFFVFVFFLYFIAGIAKRKDVSYYGDYLIQRPRKEIRENESNHDYTLHRTKIFRFALHLVSSVWSTEFRDALLVLGIPTWHFSKHGNFFFLTWLVSFHPSDCVRSHFFCILFILGLSMFNVSSARIENSQRD